MSKTLRFILLILALATAEPWGARAADAGWVARRLPWYSLPRRELAGVAPVSIATPTKAWDYGAASDRVDPFAAYGSVIVRVAVKVESGVAAISLMNGDGSVLISKEKTLSPKDGEAVVYFRIEQGSPPCNILLRNPGQEGTAGLVEVESVQVARAQALSADEMARVNLGLL